MRKFKNTRYLLQLIVILMSQWTLTFGQKLPKVQASSVRAPANIKIDGKTTEWDDQFQAHNLPNHIYYTLSNDDKNLYLTAQMDDIQGTKKIFKGGLTFTIIPLNKQSNKIAVTFPVISKKKRDEMEDGGDSRLIDSLRSSSNSGITKDHKEIYITGIPEIKDPFVSIYNTHGIIVGASYDKKMRYSYELAIPLKYLEGAISNLKSIKYNIRLNATTIEAKNRVPNPSQHIDPVVFTGVPESIDDLFNYEDSDFSGVYTLALKP